MFFFIALICMLVYCHDFAVCGTYQCNYLILTNVAQADDLISMLFIESVYLTAESKKGPASERLILLEYISNDILQHLIE